MQFDGTWMNQNGSSVTLHVAADGAVTGHFRSGKGRVAADQHYALTGRCNGDLLAFQVDWQDEDANLHAITSFTGRGVVDESGRETLHTVWVLARQYEDVKGFRPTEAWNAFLTNADVWERQA